VTITGVLLPIAIAITLIVRARRVSSNESGPAGGHEHIAMANTTVDSVRSDNVDSEQDSQPPDPPDDVNIINPSTPTAPPSAAAQSPTLPHDVQPINPTNNDDSPIPRDTQPINQANSDDLGQNNANITLSDNEHDSHSFDMDRVVAGVRAELELAIENARAMYGEVEVNVTVMSQRRNRPVPRQSTPSDSLSDIAHVTLDLDESTAKYCPPFFTLIMMTTDQLHIRGDL
jgi:hypothetical protein